MKYSKATQELIKDFWDFPINKFSSKEVSDYYLKGLNKLISNANLIIDTAPVKSAIFWSELVRTNFIIQFITTNEKIFNSSKKVEDINEAIKIIKNVYENSYQYFAFFTISNIGSVSNLYNYWYKPGKAKELDKNNANNPWDIGGAKVSGKLWVINNFPLFQFATFDIKLLREIRDSDSHESLIIRDEKIYLLDSKRPIELLIVDILEIATFLKQCIAIVSHFTLTLLIREKFWMFLLLFIQTEDKYKNALLPIHILKKVNNPKTDLNNIISKDIAALSELCIQYTLYQLWLDLKIESVRLDLRLSSLNLKIDISKVDDIRKEVFFDFYAIINLLVFKSKEIYLDHKEEYEEIDKDQIDNFNFERLLEEAKNTYLKIAALKEKNKGVWIFLNIILISFIAITAPLTRLKDNFSNLLIKNSPQTGPHL